MSMETNGKYPTSAPFNQWQNFSYPPYAYEPKDDDYKVIETINNAERNLTAGQVSVTKDIHSTTLGLRDAVEKGTLMNTKAIDKNTTYVSSAVERNGGQLMGAVQGNGGKIMTAIEKVAGETRLTTTVTDAASRQAAADSARDLAIAIERNGANAVNAVSSTNTSLLGAIERNAGESRVTTVNAQGIIDAKLTDVRHSILNDVNRTGAEMVNSNIQNLNVLTKHVTDSAWESRTALASGFGQTNVGMEKIKSDLESQASHHYASMMLEQQRLSQFMTSKTDGQFAATQNEILRSKADLSAQAASQFSVTQMEQQKMGSAISAQMAEAKYDALKNHTEMSKQLAECCCELKGKNDQLDRERLRDENTVYKINPYGPVGGGILGAPGYPLGGGILGGPGFGGYGGYGGYGGGHAGPYGNHEGRGNVHVYSDNRDRRGRSRSRSCSPNGGRR
jgi:hypothetical protein